jgi:hypothetical protein
MAFCIAYGRNRPHRLIVLTKLHLALEMERRLEASGIPSTRLSLFDDSLPTPDVVRAASDELAALNTPH